MVTATGAVLPPPLPPPPQALNPIIRPDTAIRLSLEPLIDVFRKQ